MWASLLLAFVPFFLEINARLDLHENWQKDINMSHLKVAQLFADSGARSFNISEDLINSLINLL